MNPPIGLIVTTPPTTLPAQTDHAFSTKRCFDHFRLIVRRDREARQKFSDFINRDYKSVTYKWFKGDNFPVGINLLKLRFGLEAYGYEPAELRQLTPDVYKLAKLVAYELYTHDDIASFLGVTDQTVLHNLRGMGQFATDKAEFIQLIVSENEQRLKDYEANLKRPQQIPTAKTLKRPDPPVLPPSMQVPTSTAAPVVEVAPGIPAAKLTTDEIIAIFSHMVQTMRPLADFLLSDRCSAEDRDRLRQEAGRVGVFDLKNKLVRLCGERARNTL
jgi:hypothetical protein